MTIELNLPDDIAHDLFGPNADLSRAALEALAVEGYRDGRLTEEQLRRMLDLQSRFDVHAFLKQHQTPLNYTATDLDQDLTVVRSLRPE